MNWLIEQRPNKLKKYTQVYVRITMNHFHLLQKYSYGWHENFVFIFVGCQEHFLG